MSERIQKLLSTLGVASRREVERMIAEGRILVNGRPAELGQAVSHEDKIRVDGRPIGLQRKAEPARVLIYKKRTGEVVTREDPEGRRTVFRKLPPLQSGRWIAIGRLDINTSGLLLLTNHGELARRLMHPSFEIPRDYAVRIHGTVDAAVVARLTQGVELDDGLARFESMRAEAHEDGEGSNQWFRVRLREGRNREVRRLVESQGLEVSRLIRVSYGPIELGRGLKSGTSREATPAELEALLEAVGLQAESAPSRGKRTPGGGRSGVRKPSRSEAPPQKRAGSRREFAGRESSDERSASRPSREAREPRAGDRSRMGPKSSKDRRTEGESTRAAPRASRAASSKPSASRPSRESRDARVSVHSKPAAASRTKRGDGESSRAAPKSPRGSSSRAPRTKGRDR